MNSVRGWRGDEVGYITLVPDRYVRQGPDPVADPVFQVWPALRICRLAGFAVLAEQVAPEKEPKLPRMTQHRGTFGRQVGEQPGE